MTQAQTFLFKTLTTDDVPVILPIERAAQSHPWSEKIMKSCFGGRYQVFGCFIQSNERETLVAVAFFENVLDEATLMNLIVDPKWQGQGIGEALLTHGIDWCTIKQVEFIWLEVRVSNVAATQLYQKLDFIEVARREDYYPTASGREDGLVMSLKL